MSRVLRIATRRSELAQWQARHVADLLGAPTELVLTETRGDKDQRSPISEIGGKGVFAREVQLAVLDGRADLAVHSAKDLPSVTPDGLTIGAAPPRGDARDALVGAHLDDLPEGATVATGSNRRRVQLRHLRPDLRFEELRGNIATRLEKAPNFNAIVVACAALDRLGLEPAVRANLTVGQMVPQVGQGTLAVECRSDDAHALELLAGIECETTRRCLDAERAFLVELGGDCDLPAGAHATLLENGDVRMRGVLADLDQRSVARNEITGPDGVELGASLAQQLRFNLANGGK